MIAINLEELRSIIPDLTSSWAGERLDAALFCLDHNGHSSTTKMELTGRNDHCNLSWTTKIDQKIKNTYNDTQEATEKGAEGMAALLVDKLTKYKVVRRSLKGTGIDYWMGHKDESNSGLLFQDAARLEISGLLSGSDSQYSTRVKQKSLQPAPSDNTGLPAYVSVTDFSKPRTTFIKV